MPQTTQFDIENWILNGFAAKFSVPRSSITRVTDLKATFNYTNTNWPLTAPWINTLPDIPQLGVGLSAPDMPTRVTAEQLGALLYQRWLDRLGYSASVNLGKAAVEAIRLPSKRKRTKGVKRVRTAKRTVKKKKSKRAVRTKSRKKRL